MISIVIKKKEIAISGHANYDDLGKDIVCASVSSIVITTVNAILKFDNSSILVDENNGICIKVLKNIDFVNLLIENMIELLEDLCNQYSKNIKIRRC